MEPQNLMMALIAEQCQRYDDLVNMFKARNNLVPLTEQQRGLFSTAYKNILSSRRTAWRSISAYQEKLTKSQSEQNILEVIDWYKRKIEKQIRMNCLDALQIINQLIKISPSDSNIFYYRMKGDYYRYLTQITKDQQLKQNQQQSIKAYQQAQKLAFSTSLRKTSPILLGVFLNLSVFYYQIMGNIQKAIDICEKGFNEASDKLNDISDDEFKDTTTIMQLMYDNLTQWKQQLKS